MSLILAHAVVLSVLAAVAALAWRVLHRAARTLRTREGRRFVIEATSLAAVILPIAVAVAWGCYWIVVVAWLAVASSFAEVRTYWGILP